MTNERWLRRVIQRHFRAQGYKVNMKGLRVGNSVINGEAENDSEKIALEIKSGHDNVIRGIGQLTEALAFGYNQVALVTTLRAAKKIDSVVFDKLGLVLLGIDSKGNVTKLV